MSADFYTRTMYKQYKYHATWEPGRKLQVGDIGEMDGYEFTRISSLANEGIDAAVETDDSLGNLEFSSDKNMRFHAKLKGEAKMEEFKIGEADAGAVFEFAADQSVLFQLQGVRTHYIDDQIALAREIERRYNHPQGDKKWEKSWVVITELIEAEAGTIIVSNGSGAKIALKVNGDADVKKMVVASAKADIGATFSKSIGFKAVNQAGLTPLFKLKGIRTGWFDKTGKFKKRGEAAGGEELVEREAVLEVEPAWASEE